MGGKAFLGLHQGFLKRELQNWEGGDNHLEKRKGSVFETFSFQTSSRRKEGSGGRKGAKRGKKRGVSSSTCPTVAP